MIREGRREEGLREDREERERARQPPADLPGKHGSRPLTSLSRDYTHVNASYSSLPPSLPLHHTRTGRMCARPSQWPKRRPFDTNLLPSSLPPSLRPSLPPSLPHTTTGRVRARSSQWPKRRRSRRFLYVSLSEDDGRNWRSLHWCSHQHQHLQQQQCEQQQQ